MSARSLNVTMNKQKNNNTYDQRFQSLLTMDEALKFLLSASIVKTNTCVVSLDNALQRVLAEDICANINVPEFDNSAMDGYAIALKPEQINVLGVLNFKITDRIQAGSMGKALALGCAARIFTGAAIPQGANTVIIQEICEVSKDGCYIETWQPLSLNENIRPLGNDIRSGDIILKKGRQLKAQDIALIASIGIKELKVFKRLKVGLFFTGDELIDPGKTLKNGEIFNSNRYALVALLTQLNCNIVNLGNIKDDFKATLNALNTLANNCDLIITTGGVSVGEEDHVKPAVEKLGQLSLWRIKVKPGKPLAFGHIDKSAFIGLPGNPISAMVTFFLFAQPFIKKMQGMSNYKNQPIQVQTNFDSLKPKSRREFVRVRLDHTTTPASAYLYPKQGSDVLSSIVWADGLLEIPENTTFTQGELLNYYSLTSGEVFT